MKNYLKEWCIKIYTESLNEEKRIQESKELAERDMKELYRSASEAGLRERLADDAKWEEEQREIKRQKDAYWEMNKDRIDELMNTSISLLTINEIEFLKTCGIYLDDLMGRKRK